MQNDVIKKNMVLTRNVDTIYINNLDTEVISIYPIYIYIYKINLLGKLLGQN